MVRRYTYVYQTTSTERTHDMNINIKYATLEKDIRKGTVAELMAWWDVALDYLSVAKKHDGFTVKEYSALAEEVGHDYKANTIQQNIGHILWAMDSGWKKTASGVKDATGEVVKSMFHVRKTKNPPKKNVKVPTKRSAYDDVFSQAKNLSKESRQRLVSDLLKTL
jgi:hypothetical protein